MREKRGSSFLPHLQREKNGELQEILEQERCTGRAMLVMLEDIQEQNYAL
jgi:hypothetical protein